MINTDVAVAVEPKFKLIERETKDPTEDTHRQALYILR